MSMKRKTCFVISPIGESGTDIRRDADDLLEIIIRPALEKYDFEVIRGDHRSEAGQIDVDVIKMVQSADLCIADVSMANVNVFYEVGRRDETGKYLILLKRKDTGPLPVDIATRRYIEYDLDDRNGIRDARQQLRNFIDPIIDSIIEGPSTGASLAEIAETLQRVERKVDRLQGGGSAPAAAPVLPNPTTTGGNNNQDPMVMWRAALKTGNIPLMEQCLDQLQVRMDRWKFLDTVVEITASRGSRKAGQMLIDCADEFFDESTITFKQKVEYLSCLVSFSNRQDCEGDVLELVERLANRLEVVSDGEPAELVAQIHNQRNRLYYGIFANTEDPEYLRKAVHELRRVIALDPDASYAHYNLALCYKQMKDEDPEALEAALHEIGIVMELDAKEGKTDSDHLKLACQLAKEAGDERFPLWLDELRKVDPYQAVLLD